MMTDQERLDEAKQAYHDLVTGKGVRELRDSNGETVVYSPTSPQRLLQYIAELERAISGSCLGPMRPMFR